MRAMNYACEINFLEMLYFENLLDTVAIPRIVHIFLVLDLGLFLGGMDRFPKLLFGGGQQFLHSRCVLFGLS